MFVRNSNLFFLRNKTLSNNGAQDLKVVKQIPSLFRSEIPIKNFGPPFKKLRFSCKISVREDQITLPFTFEPKFLLFL